MIATCNTCGERSRPMDPKDVETWASTHNKRHDREERRDRMKDQGHVMEYNITVAECDSEEGTVSCSCGWQGGHMKSCWFAERFDDHLREVESVMEQS